MKELNKKAQAAVRETFESNPKAEKYHVTKDGMCFENVNNANAHEADLRYACTTEQERTDVAGVFEITRAEALAKVKSEGDADAKAAAKAETKKGNKK